MRDGFVEELVSEELVSRIDNLIVKIVAHMDHKLSLDTSGLR